MCDQCPDVNCPYYQPGGFCWYEDTDDFAESGEFDFEDYQEYY